MGLRTAGITRGFGKVRGVIRLVGLYGRDKGL